MAGSILLADDEEKILKTLGRALRDDGHEVTTAPNAKEAARLLGERSFDLLIIDFLMPDRTGLDVADIDLTERSDHATGQATDDRRTAGGCSW